MRRFRPGDRVRIAQGSGTLSGMVGTVVPFSMVKVDGRGIPTNIFGAYAPVDTNREVAVLLDADQLTNPCRDALVLMFKNRLSHEGCRR